MRYSRRRRGLLPTVVLATVVVVLIAVAYLGTEETGTQTAGAQGSGGASGVPEGEPVAAVAAEVGPSSVQINVSASQETPFGTQEQDGVGSGVIYREDGYIVTNNHVVEGASEVSVSFADGSTEEGEVVGTDPETDLAVVRVDRDNLPAAVFSDGEGLAVGQMAVAIGSPSGFQSTVTSGVVSGLGREFPAEYTGGTQESALVDLIQTDAPISPGNSGGALAARNGEVIGINVAYVPPESGAESIGFAIPSYTASAVADQLIETGEAVHPYLGVSLSDLTPEAAESFGLTAEAGALVEEAVPGEPAAQAGIEAGDAIVAVGDKEVRSSGDLLSALRRYAPGDTVGITVLRDGEEITVQATLGERE